jgi:enamine deaminase RidA (YjgF/YER057c/UK114 family)
MMAAVANQVWNPSTREADVTQDVKVSVTTHGNRTRASTGSAWEPKVGYSRAVRVGGQIAVTGTVGIEADSSFGPTLETQARRSLTIIRAAIEALGGSLGDVVRTRIYVIDISQWEEVGRVHGEFFGAIRPATTMVEVAKLIDAAALVEIEADAIVA